MDVDGKTPKQEFADAGLELLTRQRDAIIADLCEVIGHEIHELVADPRLASLLRASVVENIVSAINFLESNTEVEDLDATTAALTHAKTLAQQDVPLSALFRAYRLGHAMVVRLGLDVIGHLGPEHHIALTQVLIERSASFIDKVCEQVGRAYEAERDQWVADRGGIRQQWVSDVLAGRPIDLVEAEANLGYRFSGTHVGVQMWVSGDVTDVDARAAFEETRRLLVTQLSAVAPPLLIPRDEREMHAWFAVRGSSSVPMHEISDAVQRSRGPEVRLALGRAETGLDGFRLTSSQAKRVKDVILTSSNPMPRSAGYDELGPVALMASDLPALRRFVVRVLGDLARNGEREQVLRETLRSFLNHNRSYAATAQAMILHRNSVQYRVQRALELCQLDLNEADVAFDLHVALSAVHWLGRAILE